MPRRTARKVKHISWQGNKIGGPRRSPPPRPSTECLTHTCMAYMNISGRTVTNTMSAVSPIMMPSILYIVMAV
jgi:hypothetical protein